jgi:hypothetical protein
MDSMQILNLDRILDKGIEDENSLLDIEQPIFSIAYLESIADSQSWDHFFTYSIHLLDEVERTLKKSGDFQSLSILNHYKKHFNDLGVTFTAQSIDNYLCSATEEYFSKCPDWREKFEACSIQRWELLSHYYKSLGVILET